MNLHPRSSPRLFALAVATCAAVGSLGCLSSPKSEDCRALLDSEARLRDNARTYPDPKTPAETAQNWADAAKVLQSEHDTLKHLTLREERLAAWGARLRDELPFRAAVARHLAESVRKGDGQATSTLRAEWEERGRRVSAIVADVRTYCAVR